MTHFPTSFLHKCAQQKVWSLLKFCWKWWDQRLREGPSDIIACLSFNKPNLILRIFTNKTCMNWFFLQITWVFIYSMFLFSSYSSFLNSSKTWLTRILKILVEEKKEKGKVVKNKCKTRPDWILCRNRGGYVMNPSRSPDFSGKTFVLVRLFLYYYLFSIHLNWGEIFK